MNHSKKSFTILLSCLFLLTFTCTTYCQQELTLLNDGEDQFQFADNLEEIIDINENVKTYEVLKANCFCKVSLSDLTNIQNANSVCLDLSSRTKMSFTGATQQSVKNQNKCTTRCSDVAAGLTSTELQRIADCACKANKPNGHKIRVYSKIGTRKYKSARTLGYLVKTPALTKTDCACPKGWVVDKVQTDINRKCKKAVCTLPYPVKDNILPKLPGYVRNNVITQWRKGKCKTTQISAAECSFRKY